MIKLAENSIRNVGGINLEQLSAVDFDGRVDTKYIFHSGLLQSFLARIKNHVHVLELNGKRSFEYRNIYFDTQNFEFFRQHHAGYLNRVKVRARAYGEKGPFVFEIKTKTNKSITVKQRINLASIEECRGQNVDDFLIAKLGYGLKDLPNQVGVNYRRLTFANKQMTEKFTLDLGLTGISNGEQKLFNDLIIAEVKQEQFKYNSVFVSALKELGIQPGGFSKYCTTVMNFYPELKRNRFKPILTKLEKIDSRNGIAA